MDIISNGKMKNTEENTEETPQQIMFKEFRMIRCEAKLEAFKCFDCLFRRIPEVQQNALLLYADLKEYCRNTVSTCIEHKMLLEKWKNTFEGAMFLQEQGVLVKENNKVSLHNHFTDEKGIQQSPLMVTNK